MDDLYLILFFATLSIKILVVVFGVYHFPNLSAAFRVILILLLLSTEADISSYLSASAAEENSSVFNLYTYFEGTLFLLFYYFSGEKKLVPWALAVFLLSATYEWAFLKVRGDFLEFSVVVQSLLMIFFAVRFFYKLLSEMAVPRLTDYPEFWMNCGTLIYFSASIFMFAFANLIIKGPITWEIWSLHNLFHLMFVLSTAMAFWKIQHNKT